MGNVTAEDYLSVGSAVPCAISADGTAVLATVSGPDGDRAVRIDIATGEVSDGPPLSGVISVRPAGDTALLVETHTPAGSSGGRTAYGAAPRRARS